MKLPRPAAAAAGAHERPTVLVGRRGLVLVSHGSDGDSLVAKEKAPRPPVLRDTAQ